jgi:dihydropteroate synthase
MQQLSARSRRWRLRTRQLEFGQRPMLMGIVNVTPDSFSDGGRFARPEAAVEHALKLVADGAEILDIGAESTRPYASPVSLEEERRRVMPVIEALVHRTSVPLSIDTYKSSVAAAALEAGVEIVNDVTGLEGDPGMVEVARQYEAGVCAMHMQGTPQTMQDNPVYSDVVGDIQRYLAHRRDALAAAGLALDRICLDPGIGFGKTHQHNLILAANCHVFHQLGCPLLVGPSRKGFIAKVVGDKEADRVPGTIGVAISLALQGVQVLRVHDVAAVGQALLLLEATGGLDGRPGQLS